MNKNDSIIYKFPHNNNDQLNIFGTSLRKGLVLIYQFKGYLRPSSNFDPLEDLYNIDYFSDNNKYDITLNNENEYFINIIFKGGYQKLGAILTNFRIIIVNESLHCINNITLPNINMRLNFWFGNCFILQNDDKVYYITPDKKEILEYCTIRTDKESETIAYNQTVDRIGVIWYSYNQEKGKGFIQVRNHEVSTFPQVIESLKYGKNVEPKIDQYQASNQEIFVRIFQDSIQTDRLAFELVDNNKRGLLEFLLKGKSNNSLNYENALMMKLLDSNVDYNKINLILKKGLNIDTLDEINLLNFVKSNTMENCYHNIFQELIKFAFTIKDVKTAFRIMDIRESYLQMLLIVRKYEYIEKKMIQYFKNKLTKINLKNLILKYQSTTMQQINTYLNNDVNTEVSCDIDFESLLTEIQNQFIKDPSYTKLTDKLSSENISHLLKIQTEHQSVIQKLKLEFGESAYRIISDNNSSLFAINSDLLEEKIGLKTGNISNNNKNDMDNDEDVENNNDSGNNYQALYWHFSEGKGNSLLDTLSSNEEDIKFSGNGLVEGSKELFDWHEIKNSKPMERIDKWGKDSGVQYFIKFKKPEAGKDAKDIKKNYCKILSKNWSKNKFKNLSIELWFNPSEESGVLWATGGQEIMFGFKNRNIFLQNNNKKVELDIIIDKQNKEDAINKDIGKISKDVWQHLAITYNSNEDEVLIYLNTKLVFKANTSLNISFIHLNSMMFFLQYYGDFTEQRIWRNVKTEFELREEHSYPLGIISEKKAEIKVILTSIDESKREDDFSAFKLDAPEGDNRSNQFSGFSISAPENCFNRNIINDENQNNEKDIPNNLDISEKELKTEVIIEEKQNNKFINNNQIMLGKGFNTIPKNTIPQIWEPNNEHLDQIKDVIQKDDNNIILTIEKIVMDIVILIRNFFVLDKFEDGLKCINNFKAFLKLQTDKKKEILGKVTKISACQTISSLAFEKFNNLQNEDDKEAKKAIYMKVYNMKAQSIDYVIRIHWITIKWQIENNCYMSAKQVINSYIRVKKTDDDVQTALDNQQVKDLNIWMQKIEDMAKEDCRDEI